MNFSGNYRTQADFYNNLSLGAPGVPNDNKTFIESRALLDPEVVIDDHFVVNSQWSLLNSPTLSTSAIDGGQGGYIFGDPSASALVFNRAWLEWTSDFGVLRVGRMPFSWGYGLIWDAGDNIWDNFQTTLDRIEYRLHLGHVIGGIAYSKPLKLSVLDDENDGDFYTVFLQYNNPESDVEAGILYEKQARSTTQAAELTQNAPTQPGQAVNPRYNPYQLPSNYSNPYSLSVNTPWPISNNVVDLYLKKSIDYFSFGGEVGWLSGTSAYGGQFDSLNALAVTLNAAFELHSFKAFIEALYASGDDNLSAGHNNGFELLHRNRSPGLILGQELLGAYAGNNVGWGNLTVYGNQNSFSGVFYVHPGVRVDWTPSFSTGAEMVLARKASVQQGEGTNLGVELDISAEYAIYKNFIVGGEAGYLFAGDGILAGTSAGAIGVRTTVGLKF